MMSDSLSSVDVASFDVSNSPSPFDSGLLQQDSMLPGSSVDFLLKLIPIQKESVISLAVTERHFRDISSWFSEYVAKQLIEQQVATFSFFQAADRAITSYRTGLISLGRAAEIAGLPYDKMIEQLKQHGVRLRFGPSSIEEAEEEQQAFWRRVRRQQDLPR